MEFNFMILRKCYLCLMETYFNFKKGQVLFVCFSEGGGGGGGGDWSLFVVHFHILSLQLMVYYLH